jgi:hypothetical protein
MINTHLLAMKYYVAYSTPFGLHHLLLQALLPSPVTYGLRRM